MVPSVMKGHVLHLFLKAPEAGEGVGGGVGVFTTVNSVGIAKEFYF